MSETLYPIRAVSKLTGLSIDTLRAWERRYGAVVPERSDRGRQYSQEQVQRLTLLHALVERGHAIGLVASLQEPELRRLIETEHLKGREQHIARQTSEPLIEPIVDALAKFDHSQVNDELARLAALLTSRDLVYRVALPLMREVGERWHRGDFGIAQEHLASAALRSLFGSLVRLHPVRPSSKKILIGTLTGDLHDFGVLAAAMIAAINGLDPIFLGANLPGSELAQAAKTTGAEFVLVGVSTADSGTTRELLQLVNALPAGSALWMGGPKPPRIETKFVPSGVRVLSLSTIEELEAECRRVNPII